MRASSARQRQASSRTTSQTEKRDAGVERESSAHPDPTTPDDVVRYISRTYPHRDGQIRVLAALLSPLHASPPTVVVHGPRDAGKSTVVRETLRCLDDGVEVQEDESESRAGEEGEAEEQQQQQQASDNEVNAKSTTSTSRRRRSRKQEVKEEDEESAGEKEQQVSAPGELLGIKTRSQTRRSGGDGKDPATAKRGPGKRAARDENRGGQRGKRRRSSSADSSRTSPDPLASSSFSSSYFPADGGRRHSPSRALPHAIINCDECLTTRHLLMKITSRCASAMAQLPLSANPQNNATTNSSSSSTTTTTNAKRANASASSHTKCDHVSQLPAVFHRIFAARSWRSRKFVLVLKGIDELRESGNTAHMLVAGLARTAMLVPELTILFILNHPPRPFFTHAAGAPHVYFPPFTREACVSILSSRPPQIPKLNANDDSDDDDDDDEDDEDGDNKQAREALLAEIYPHFVGLVYDALIGPTGDTLPVFQRVCEQLWPHFVAPVVRGEKPGGGEYDVEWDFSRLLIRNRALFRTKGEEFLVHHLVGEERVSRLENKEEEDEDDDDDKKTTTSTTTVTTKPPSSSVSSTLPRLPYLSTLILIAAFLAAHIPPRLDMTFFSKYTDSKKKRIGGRRKKRTTSIAARDPDDDVDDASAPSSPRKGGGGGGGGSTASTITQSSLPQSTTSSSVSSIQPRPFSLERLLAILHAIDPTSQLDTALPTATAMDKQPPLADAVFAELATLQRLRLVVPATGAHAASTTSTAAMDVVDSVERWVFNAGNPVGGKSGAGGGGGGGGGYGGGRAGNAWIQTLAKGVGVDLEDHFPGGL